MTDTPEKKPEEIAAEAALAAAAVDAQSAEPEKAPEVSAEPAAAPEPVQTPPEGLNPLDPAGPDAEEEDPAPVANPNALRGVPAGPPPHPRTV